MLVLLLKQFVGNKYKANSIHSNQEIKQDIFVNVCFFGCYAVLDKITKQLYNFHFFLPL